MTVLGRLYRGETRFDFVRSRRRWFTISAVLLVVSVGALLWRGLNRSVDFVGGTVVEVGNRAGASVADVRDALAAVGQEDARVQVTGGGAGVRVQTEELDFEAETRLVATVAATAGVQPDDASVQSVGPTFGSQVTESAVRALIFFLIVIAIFISWRLEWKMAVAALAALSHDLVITAGIYSLLGFEVTPATVIAVLTILGYSLYDTVVVFDKVLENVEERSEKDTYTNIVNLSMNQVLMRSVNTSLTSLLPIGSLLFFGSFLLGAATLRQFALALFIGVAAGTYSSIFVAAPLLAGWKEREDHWQRMQRRAARKGEPEALVPEQVPERPEPEPERPPVAAMAIPRPPKRRRRKR